MKYIRTMNSVYSEETYKALKTTKEILSSCRDLFVPSQPDTLVVKQANTIEELCDEFVAFHKTLKLTYCIKKTPFEEQDENFNIYGAIWTNKGLIYVAKMNDKGELELL